ncbi:low molecular weight phosphotyrosine protein phosphatase [Alteromonas sediminis]|uniref:protein-tyrosine-phosphatase n=1 Tax=Alteromonas sediminis TaxID=2259342 RepID=A0A3N5Y4S9_9ALTE|nr:low molecular weight protein-tyrosine-phosphatase [Alteromonas sediminis]RPJ68620.1 low molecular weight phosphotyrosine protein phosphatase [Alteromonas sediminis]
MPSGRPSVLFVCLGNICRSPTAEAVFRQKAKDAGLSCKIDSAGTHGYHIGKAPDKRSQEVGKARGYNFKGIQCRRVAKEDFTTFDYILAMDASNLDNLKAKAEEKYPDKTFTNMHLFLDFAESETKEVPDPYYGGRKGFELVLDLIEQASDGLIAHIRQQAR